MYVTPKDGVLIMRDTNNNYDDDDYDVHVHCQPLNLSSSILSSFYIIEQLATDGRDSYHAMF